MNKLAILGTTEARKANYSADCRRIESCAASELLSWLVREQYTVVVVTTRFSLNEHDKCWMDLILTGNIYLPERWEQPNCKNTQYVSNWRKVFERFGLIPPSVDDDWIEWKRAAAKQGVITSIYDIKDFDSIYGTKTET